MFVEKGKIYRRLGSQDKVRVICVYKVENLVNSKSTSSDDLLMYLNARPKKFVKLAILQPPGGTEDFDIQDFQNQFILHEEKQSNLTVSDKAIRRQRNQQENNGNWSKTHDS